jgi:leucine dehydrogenase
MHLVDLPAPSHLRVVEAVDDSIGFHAFIAVHDTTLGPAVGGTRLWPYASRADALADVMRLSEAMSFKAALAGVPFGGGKSVVVGDSRTIDRRATFLAHGRFIATLGGAYIAGEDVGTTPADMHVIREVTPWAAGLTDPSESTGHGVCQAIRAAAEIRWGTPSIAGRTILVQGVGNVGACVARELAAEGGRIVVADIDTARAHRIADACGATVVSPTAILEEEGDVLAPCALGGILNGETIPRLRVAVVAGAANNMLGGPGDDAALALRGILYIPDFVANAGGIIHGAQEVCGWSADQSRAATAAIAATTHRVVAIAAERGVTTAVAALQLAKERIALGRQPQSA